MPDQNRKKLKGCRGCFLWFILFAAFIYLYGTINDRFGCVEMPNGFTIGRAKVSSLLVGWRPDVALKFPDGRILLRGDHHKILFWDEDSVGGIYNTGALNFEREPFIYVKEIGYISELRNPKLYSEYFELKVQSGTITRPKAYVTIMAAYLSLEYNTQVDSGNNWHGVSGDGIGSTGKYRQGWCPTALFEPDIVDLKSILAK